MATMQGDMVQVHVLTSFPAVLLNRDDVGLAKRVPFGNAVRVRVSSQCLKKHWRDSTPFTDLDLSKAVRSRLIFDQFVVQPLLRDGVSSDEAAALTELLMSGLLRRKAEGTEGKKADAAEEEAEEGNDEEDGAAETETGQILVLSGAEAQHLSTIARELRGLLAEHGVAATDKKAVKKFLASKEIKDWWRTRKEVLEHLPASFDTAMFGRFVTSDILARIDSAVSVAHAITTHAEQAETDYFTAVDTLSDDSGAGHLNDTELTSGVFYLYAVIDMAQLRENLGAQAGMAEQLARRLVIAMATVAPNAKSGSTAPFAHGEFVLLERGRTQPRTLANAFRDSVPAFGRSVGDVMRASVQRVVEHRGRLAGMYGDLARVEHTAASTIHGELLDGTGPAAPLSEALDAIFGAESR